MRGKMVPLDIREVSKSYDHLLAVNRVSLKVKRGSIYGLLGPNGAGKTTTIRMAMNIIAPDSGEILIFSEPLSERAKDRIGYLPEERGLYTKMKVGELLYFLGRIKSLPPRESRLQVDYWLSRVELSDYKDKRVEELSKGMQQKLQVAATVLHKPDLLILDEPFAGLDPVNTNLVKDIILELNRDGATVILSTHQMEQVERMCHHIFLIDKGEKVLDGPLTEIKKRYGKNTVVMSFTGDGNFLKSLPGILKTNDYGNYIELTLEKGADPNEILKKAAARLIISRFELVEPSLTDIFIEQVKGGIK
jgi:ABC-2 type transport system ATP-binding protein